MIAGNEDEEYVLNLARKLDAELKKMMAQNPRISVMTAAVLAALDHPDAVSYTHLDVYKRQPLGSRPFTRWCTRFPARRPPASKGRSFRPAKGIKRGGKPRKTLPHDCLDWYNILLCMIQHLTAFVKRRCV